MELGKEKEPTESNTPGSVMSLTTVGQDNDVALFYC